MRDAPHSAHMSAKATKGMPENARRAPFGLLAAVPATQTMASADGRTAAACGLGSEGDGKSAAAGFRRNGGLERAAHRRKLLQPKLKVRSYAQLAFAFTSSPARFRFPSQAVSVVFQSDRGCLRKRLWLLVKAKASWTARESKLSCLRKRP